MSRARFERYECDRCGAVAEVQLGELQPTGWRHWKRRWLTVPPVGRSAAEEEFVLCSPCDDLLLQVATTTGPGERGA